MLQHENPKGQNVPQIAFAVVNAAITKWFSERLPREPCGVSALAVIARLAGP